MQSSLRVSIPHLENLDHIQVHTFLSASEYSISEKVDGAGLRFGWDETENFFIESSRSGPIKTPGDFSAYSIKKMGCPSRYSKAYDEVLDALQNFSGKFQRVLEAEFLRRGPFKIHCEMLSNYLAIETSHNELTFVSLPYDRRKLGSSMTLALIGTGQNQILIDKLVGCTTVDVKFVDIKLRQLPMDFRPEKESLLKNYYTLEEIKTSIRSKLVESVNPGILGDCWEGIVVRYSNGCFKITTEEYKRRKN